MPSDEGPALSVFLSRGWPTLAGTAGRECLPGPAARQFPGPEGAAVGWSVPPLPWPGGSGVESSALGPPGWGDPWGVQGPLILEIAAHCELHGNFLRQPGVSGLIPSDILGSW